MQIGDKVIAQHSLVKHNRYCNGNKKSVTWVRSKRPAFTGMYLGTVTLYAGTVEPGDEYETPNFTRTGQIAAVAVQPLSGGRYRRPVYAAPEDVTAVHA
jgi:hypothetical protein